MYKKKRRVVFARAANSVIVTLVLYMVRLALDKPPVLSVITWLAMIASVVFMTHYFYYVFYKRRD